MQAMDMEIMPLNRAKLNLFKGVFALGDNLIVVKTYTCLQLWDQSRIDAYYMASSNYNS